MSVKQIMLVNVKFFKKIFLVSFFLLISTSLSANEKSQIISQLNNLNTLEFTFDQLVNEKKEKGSCFVIKKKIKKINIFFIKERLFSQHDLLYLLCLFPPSYQ